MSTACWVNNDDGTVSLTIGSSKKENLIDDTASVASTSNDSEQNSLSPSNDHNGNAFANAEIEVKSPPPPIVFRPPTLPIQILKSTNWSETGTDYRMRQQTLRRKEMTAKYVLILSFVNFILPQTKTDKFFLLSTVMENRIV